MIKKLMPIVLLLIGTGAGVGAGIYLRPEPVKDPAVDQAQDATHHSGSESPAKDSDEHAKADGEMEYVKLANQFVIPVVEGEKVVALVLLALSVEVPLGQEDRIFAHEPKLRDSFLQVLFDHANVGGFEGAFTDANNLAVLRMALREVAQKNMGKEIINDVLITDLARQDY